MLRAIDDARGAITGVLELRAGTLELAALATLAVDPMARLIGRFRERYPAYGSVSSSRRTPTPSRRSCARVECELGAAPLPLRDEALCTVPLSTQELMFVLLPGALDGEASAPAAVVPARRR